MIKLLLTVIIMIDHVDNDIVKKISETISDIILHDGRSTRSGLIINPSVYSVIILAMGLVGQLTGRMMNRSTTICASSLCHCGHCYH